jgi:hypothetical protein
MSWGFVIYWGIWIDRPIPLMVIRFKYFKLLFNLCVSTNLVMFCTDMAASTARTK